MPSKYRMLIWEQSRAVGLLCAIVYFTALISLYLVRSIMSREEMDLYAGIGDYQYLVFIYLMLIPVCLVFNGWNRNGRPTARFDPRLLRLPTTTRALVFTVMGTRLAYLLLLAAALKLTAYLLLAMPTRPLHIVLSVIGYIVLQSVTWASERLRGVLLSILAGCIVLWWLYNLSSSAAQGMDAIISSPPLMFILLAFTTAGAFVIAFAGVHFLRIDRHSTLPSPAEIRLWMNDLAAPPAREFNSPLEAQHWYERRRVGRLLPMFTVVFMSMLTIPRLIYWNFTGLTFFLYLPLMAGALLTGIAVFAKGGSNYAFLRPVSTKVLAGARITVLAHSLFAVLCIAFVILTIEYNLKASTSIPIGSGGSSVLVSPMATLASKVLFIGALAWILLWLPAWLTITIFFAVGGVHALPMTAARYVHPAFGIVPPITWSAVVIGLISVGAVTTAWWHGLISNTHMLLALLYWLLLPFIAIAVANTSLWPEEVILYFGVLLGWLHLPFVVVPQKIQAQRAQ